MSVVLSFNSLAKVSALPRATVSEIMLRPLILGACVSADANTPSPGKRMALHHTQHDKINKIAFEGRLGREIIRCISQQDLEDRTVVIAIDLLFWDSTLPCVTETLYELYCLVEKCRRRHIRLVLGEVPELLWGRQPQRCRLNQELARIRTEFSGCYVIPLDQMYLQILRDGFLVIHGQKYSIHDLIPDGLHLSPIASAFLADNIFHQLHQNSQFDDSTFKYP